MEPNLFWRPQTLRLSKYWPFIWCSWTNSLRAPPDHRQIPNQTRGWGLPLLRGNKLGLTLKIRISLLSISSVHTLKNSLWRVLETYGIYFSFETYHLVWTIVRGFFFFFFLFVLKPIINAKHPVIKTGKVTNYGLPLLHFNAFFLKFTYSFHCEPPWYAIIFIFSLSFWEPIPWIIFDPQQLFHLPLDCCDSYPVAVIIINLIPRFLLFWTLDFVFISLLYLVELLKCICRNLDSSWAKISSAKLRKIENFRFSFSSFGFPLMKI